MEGNISKKQKHVTSTYEFKVQKKVITTKTFNVDLHNKFIKFGQYCFFYFIS